VTSALAIGQNGLGGRVWVFRNETEAQDHPIVQYGDVVATSGADLFRGYGRLSLKTLCKFLPSDIGPDRHAADALRSYSTFQGAKPAQDLVDAAKRACDHVFARMTENAKRPPEDPAEVLTVIRQDRRSLTQKTGQSSQPRTTLAVSKERLAMVAKKTENKAANEAEAEVEDEAEGEAEGTKRQMFRMHEQGVIHIVAEGNPYKGDKGAELWNKFREGATVAELREAGLTASNIRRARRKGYITITNPPEADTPAEGEEQAAA
jgi:hypothetical protein